MTRACSIAQAIATFPAHSVQAIKSGMRAATMQMPANQWMVACAKADAFNLNGAISQVRTNKP